MKKLIDAYCRLLGWAIVACLAVMVVLVFGNVVMRYVFNSGITLSEELSRWLFVWLTFLGAVIAMHERTHLGTDMLVSRLGVRGKKVFLVIGHLLMLWACWLMGTGAWTLASLNIDSRSPVMEAPQSLFYAGGLVFAASSTVILLYDLWRLLRGDLSEDELVGIRESEEEPIDAPAPVK